PRLVPSLQPRNRPRPGPGAGGDVFNGVAGGGLLVLAGRSGRDLCRDSLCERNRRALGLCFARPQRRDVGRQREPDAGAFLSAEAQAISNSLDDLSPARMNTNPITQETVLEALRQVVDPELGCNIVDLGLVYSIRIEGA